ncbi:MAG: class I SAM-dependent methyltransferase [Ahrensia sp.]|nr:class I SAM-dependent methyltransferase [Ahrensia sp.]
MADDDDLGLDAAYSLKTPQDSVRLYAKWAESYDEGFAAEQGYRTPAVIATAFAEAATEHDTPLLDVGCGTGLLAAALPPSLQASLWGLDISAQMLAVAEEKHLYQRLIEGNLLERLPFDDATFGCILSAGTFTTGHVGPQAFEELLRISKPDALFLVSVHAHYFHEAGFDMTFGELNQAGAITPIQTEAFDFYSHGDEDHAEDRGLLVSFRKKQTSSPAPFA